MKNIAKVAVLFVLGMVCCAGCQEDQEEKCSQESFETYCDGNTLVYCNWNGYVQRKECYQGELCGKCKGDRCKDVTNPEEISCWRGYLCDNLDEKMGDPECVYEHVNQPTVYDYVCIQDGEQKHWEFQKISDCDGTCDSGKCYNELDECTDSDSTLGCHGNDLYYCESVGNWEVENPKNFMKIVKARHCTENQLCVPGNGHFDDAFCSDRCQTENEPVSYCFREGYERRGLICKSTEHGLFYGYKESNSRSYVAVDITSEICDGTKIFKYNIDRDKPCNPETDQPYCTHNVAVRCNEKRSDNPNTFWSLTNCGKNVRHNTKYGRCQMVDDKALCLPTCQTKGKKHSECDGFFSNDRFEGTVPNDDVKRTIEYECREIDGNLYDYPISVKDCTECNEEKTDCKE